MDAGLLKELALPFAVAFGLFFLCVAVVRRFHSAFTVKIVMALSAVGFVLMAFLLPHTSHPLATGAQWACFGVAIYCWKLGRPRRAKVPTGQSS